LLGAGGTCSRHQALKKATKTLRAAHLAQDRVLASVNGAADDEANRLAGHGDARGLNTTDDTLALTITRRVGASLRSYRDNGSIRSIKDGRYGKYDLWEINR
jgi:hypothetical protein